MTDLTLAVVQHLTLDALDIDHDDVLNLSAAASGTHLRAAQVGAHVALVDPTGGEAALALAEPLGRDVVAVTLAPSTGTFRLRGAGLVTRDRLVENGVVTRASGAPLQVEHVLEREDEPEDAHVEIAGALVGSTFAAYRTAVYARVLG